MAMTDLKYKELNSGDALSEVIRYISQDKINLYAEAVGDFNPIHVDESYAAQTAFGGTVAHGMLILAYISEMMTGVFGDSWFSNGRLNVRFKAPARCQDTVTVSGKVDSIKSVDGNIDFICSVNCVNQRQEVVVTGGATVRVILHNQEKL